MNAPEYAVETSDLTKVYGKRVTAVDHLNLQVRRERSTGSWGRTARARPPPFGCSSGWFA